MKAEYKKMLNAIRVDYLRKKCADLKIGKGKGRGDRKATKLRGETQLEMVWSHSENAG